MVRINRPESGLFSVGCGRYSIRERGNHRFSGYIELAFNSVEMVQDAAGYFPLFYHFDAFLIDQQFNVPVQIDWELAGVHFSDPGVDGFSLVITINTYFVGSGDQALIDWERTIEPMIIYLGAIFEAPGHKIYP